MCRLRTCLFDENHGRDAAIVRNGQTGMLSYLCFHDSCKARAITWPMAQELISGDDDLSQYGTVRWAGQYSFRDLEKRVGETEDFDTLTVHILSDIANSSLSDSAKGKLYKAISKKAKTSVADILKTLRPWLRMMAAISCWQIRPSLYKGRATSCSLRAPFGYTKTGCGSRPTTGRSSSISTK